MQNGWLPAIDRTRFSIMVHSTSSSLMTMSFFRTLMAYISELVFSSASITLPKLPLPSVFSKLKLLIPIFPETVRRVAECSLFESVVSLLDPVMIDSPSSPFCESSSACLMPQFCGVISTQRWWTLILHSLHLTPWRSRPYRREPQWSQNVGLL